MSFTKARRVFESEGFFDNELIIKCIYLRKFTVIQSKHRDIGWKAGHWAVIEN